MLCRKHGQEAFKLSNAHKPERLDERARIVQAGGWLTVVEELAFGRLTNMDLQDDFIREQATSMKKVAIHYVNGTLSLSRAIGDPDYKLPQINKPSCPWEFPNGAARTFTDSVVSATPEIMTVQLSPGDDFMILACDGLWDVLFGKSDRDGETHAKRSYKDAG